MRRALLVLLVGCSIPDTQFKASTDAGTGDSGPSGVLAIVPSSSGITVDENATQQFTVTLSQAPAAPLAVHVETTSNRLGIDKPLLDFNADNFAQPQTVTLTGLADKDVADEVTELTLSAPAVDSVKVSATVHDKDVLIVLTDVAANNIVTVDEGQAVNVHVHLSNEPAGDVSVMALLGNGPISVTPSSLVFTAQNYDTDQTLRFTASTDPNIVSEDVPLTVRMGAVDKLYTVHSVDKDVLNISASPSSLTVTEQGTAGNINVALTQQPPSDVTITVATTTGHATTNKSQLTFTPQTYNVNQTIQVTAPDDPDTEDDSDTITLSTSTPGVMARSVSVTIQDNDSQQILEDVPSRLAVAENGTATFGVTLKFKPSANVNVAVSSLASGVATASPGVLTFTPTNYTTPQTVTVRGSDDNNLITNSTTIRLSEATIGMTDVPVDVTDDDQQKIVLSATTLNIPEGGSGSFNVSLMFDPGGTVTANVANTNSTALPSTPSTLTFTSADYNQPAMHKVTVSPPVDLNNVSETATITVSGAGATSSPTVMATAMDGTVIENWGFPAPPPFTGTFGIPAGFVVGYQINVGSVATLQAFNTYLASAAGQYRMALYTDAGNVPGTLVGEMTLPKVAANGVNTATLPTGPMLTAPVYWVVIRFSQTNSVAQSSSQAGRQCIRDFNIPDINSTWPTVFGSATCTSDLLLNLWITTYHQ